MRKTLIAAALFIANSAAAHELTPTYPEFKQSYVDNVLVTQQKLWNRRQDVEYYEIDVYDKNWFNIKFASANKVIKVGYLEHQVIDIYIRETDLDNVEYICTTSKQLKQDVQSTGVKSMICSRVK